MTDKNGPDSDKRTARDLDDSRLLGFEQIELLAEDETSAKDALGLAFNKRGEVPSDQRLKTDIVALGETREGLELYNFRYIGEARVFRGLMAQDLLAQEAYADAVIRGEDGFYRVDYGRVGLGDLVTDEMRASGERAIRRKMNMAH